MFDAYAEELRGDEPIASWRRAFATRESDIVHLLTSATVRWPQRLDRLVPALHCPTGPRSRSCSSRPTRRRSPRRVAWLEPELAADRVRRVEARRAACRAGRPSAAAIAAPTVQRRPRPSRSSSSPCRRAPTWPAWTSQYEGSASPIFFITPPVIGNQVPPRSASSAVAPPITGPIESGVSRWPNTIPSAGEREQADEDQARHPHPLAAGEADAERCVPAR